MTIPTVARAPDLETSPPTRVASHLALNYCYPARIDPHSNDLVAATDIAHPEVVDDIVDEIIEIVLAKGGRATIVPDGTLALRERLAMALRY